MQAPTPSPERVLRVAIATWSVAILAVALAPATAGAQCGGFCIYEVATPQMGSSYAGAGATADDAATAYLNPAGMTELNGINYLGGAVLSQVAAGFDLDAKGSAGPPPAFPGQRVPRGGDGGSLGGVFGFGGVYLALEPPAMLRLPEGLRFGFAFNNLYGGDLSYNARWIGRTYITRTRFFGLNFEPSLAYRIPYHIPWAGWLSLGAGAHILYYRLIYNARFGPGDDAATLKIHGADDVAPSFTLSTLLEPRCDTRIGIVYRHGFDVGLRGEARAPGAKKNAIITTTSSDFASDFELPQGVNISAVHELTSRWDILADAGWSDWSVYSGQSTRYRQFAQAYRKFPTLHFDFENFRHWHDTLRLAGGVRFRVSDRLLVQTGVSYDSSPVPASNRLPDIPVGETYRGSVGISWDLFHTDDTTMTVGLTYTLLWIANANVDHVVTPGNFPSTLTGTYRPDHANLIGATFAASF
jgi:long-chain fatty acid transport protein